MLLVLSRFGIGDSAHRLLTHLSRLRIFQPFQAWRLMSALLLLGNVIFLSCSHTQIGKHVQLGLIDLSTFWRIQVKCCESAVFKLHFCKKITASTQEN